MYTVLIKSFYASKFSQGNAEYLKPNYARCFCQVLFLVWNQAQNNPNSKPYQLITNFRRNHDEAGNAKVYFDVEEQR